MPCLRKDAVGEERPIAAEELDVGTVRCGEHRPTGGTLVGVEFAGDQGLERQRVAFELHRLDLEALLLGEAAFARHEDEAGVALGFKHSVPPGHRLRGRLLPQGRGGECHTGQCERAQQGAPKDWANDAHASAP